MRATPLRRSCLRLAVLALSLACLATPARALATHAEPLRGQWHLDEGGTTGDEVGSTPDSSGHDLSAAVRFAGLVPGRFGNAFQFGPSSLVFTASPLLEPPTVTAVAWVRAPSSPGGLRYVLGKGGGGCAPSAYAMYTGFPGQLNEGGLHFYVNNVTAAHAPGVAPAVIWNGAWHMVAGTFDGATARFYVDGIEVGSGQTAAPIQYGQAVPNFTIGSYAAASSCLFPTAFSGDIDETRVYGRALSPTEIARLAGHPGPDPPVLVPDGGVEPPPTPVPPTPVPPAPVPPAPAERNLTTPQISTESPQAVGFAGGIRYRCSDGTWEGLAPDPAFQYTWYRLGRLSSRSPDGMVLAPSSTKVATGPTYLLPAADAGRKFYCEVGARSASGRLLTAFSPTTILTGRAELIPHVVSGRAYGNVRVRGIDVFQTVQPNSGAQMFAFPTGAFPSLCGGGTPTSFITCGPVANPARTTYTGVALDQRKRTTAVVYVDMENAAAADAAQPLDVTLSARVGGRRLSGTLTTRTFDPPVTTTPWVTAAERAARSGRELFEVPAAWLASAVLSGEERLDIEASVALPVGAGSGALIQCNPLLLVFGCSRDDRFRLDDVPVFDDLPELTIRSLPLLRPGQATTGPGALAAPDTVLRRTVELFPGGERLNILPYNGVVNIDPLSLQATSRNCGSAPAGETAAQQAARVRACRSAHVNTQLDQWWMSNAQNRSGYDILMGVHRYDLGSGLDEPGWQRGPTTIETPNADPTIAVNDGSRGRPLTAAAHEFGHAVGFPHADSDIVLGGIFGAASSGCGGNSGGQVGEIWAPDGQGRLQGTGLERGRAGFFRRTRTARVDSAATPLFDLMSYCTGDPTAWLSARNWNRAFKVLRDVDAASRQSALGGSSDPTARAAKAGQAFAIGTVGPDGGRIVRVIPADPDNLVPAPDASSPLRLRTFDATGGMLSENGAVVTSLTDVPGAATFVVPVPAGAAAVELRSGATVVDRRERSRPPAVRVVAPEGGARAGRELVVRWTASDPDLDVLQATVEYAADGSTGWRTVFQGSSTGRVRIPGRFLEMSRRGRVRVTVNDGFNEARAQSATFRADGSPPTARILRPEAAESLQAGRVWLAGSALDDRERRLRSGSLTWFAGSRRLGTGERLRATLPAGRVTLRLRARDSRGRVVTAVRKLRVEPVTLQLRALRVPDRVGRGARSVALTVATTTPATLRSGGRSYRVGPRSRRILVLLPSNPKAGVLEVSLTITARGARQRALRETIAVLRA